MELRLPPVPCSWKEGFSSVRPQRPITVVRQPHAGIKLSWPRLSLSIAYPTQFLKQIAKVHNSMVGHWGLQMYRKRLNDPTITDRTITQFIRQYSCCQVMSRHKILIRTHPFTCASYNPFESLHIDHIGPLPVHDKGSTDQGPDQGPAFRNEHFSALSRLSQVEHACATAYSKEENGLVE